jgi:hypothetical protein
MFQQLPPHKRKQQRETVTAAAAAATATAGGEVAEAIDGGGSSKETKLKLQAEKLIAVRAVASFSVDDNADSHWEAMDWSVNQLLSQFCRQYIDLFFFFICVSLSLCGCVVRLVAISNLVFFSEERVSPRYQ